MVVKTPFVLLLVASVLSSCGSWKAPDAPISVASAAAAAAVGTVEYPRERRGAWMPADLGCPAADSESLLLIEADILGQHENTSKPLRVEKVKQHPRDLAHTLYV